MFLSKSIKIDYKKKLECFEIYARWHSMCDIEKKKKDRTFFCTKDKPKCFSGQLYLDMLTS